MRDDIIAPSLWSEFFFRNTGFFFSFYLCLHMEGREGNSGDQPGHWLCGKDLEIVHFQLWDTLMATWVISSVLHPSLYWSPAVYFSLWCGSPLQSSPAPAPDTGSPLWRRAHPTHWGSERWGFLAYPVERQVCRWTRLRIVMAKGLGNWVSAREWLRLGAAVLKFEKPQAVGGADWVPASALLPLEERTQRHLLWPWTNPPNILQACFFTWKLRTVIVATAYLEQLVGTSCEVRCRETPVQTTRGYMGIRHHPKGE